MMFATIENLKSLQVGQLLLVETNAGELLTGTLKNINTKYFMVELDNVRDIKTNYEYQSPQTLAYTQMKTIKLMLNDNKNRNEIKDLNGDANSKNITENFEVRPPATTEGSSFTSQGKKDNLIIQLTDLDLQLHQQQLDKMTFITQTDQKYHKALKDIKSQSVIGLLIDPVEMGRHCKTSLMAISTFQNIYIFDFLALGKIFKELQEILEAEWPHKAVHFCHKIADHLKYRHNVLLKGIFDTFLAYCVVTNKKTNLTLEETVQKVFSIPEVYFETDCENMKPINSYHRPLSYGQRMRIAKKVAFQLKLYDHLLHEYMLRNFYKQCNMFSQTFCNNSDNFHVGQQLHPRSRAGYEHIQPSGNWSEKLNIDLDFLNNHEQSLKNNENSEVVIEQ